MSKSTQRNVRRWRITKPENEMKVKESKNRWQQKPRKVKNMNTMRRLQRETQRGDLNEGAKEIIVLKGSN